jgi:hypothetical protein
LIFRWDTAGGRGPNGFERQHRIPVPPLLPDLQLAAT